MRPTMKTTRQNTLVMGSTGRFDADADAGVDSSTPTQRRPTASALLEDANPNSTEEPTFELIQAAPAPLFEAIVSNRIAPPVSSRFESAWFSATSPNGARAAAARRAPLMEGLEQRRGWNPPNSSRSIAFTMVSLLLVGFAVGGTVFFLGPDSKKARSPDAISTSTITNADMPATPPTPTAPPPATTPAPEPTPSEHVIRAGDLPTASLVNPKPEPNAFGSTKPAAVALRPRAAEPRQQQQQQRQQQPTPTRAKEGSSNRTLPDLDRAAAATGMVPAQQQDDTSFSTPSPAPAPGASADGAQQAVPPAPPSAQTETPAPAPAPAPAPPPPPPSEVMPELQLQR
jgi:hypothetical protein